jgi:hypothetical protein
MTPSPSYLITGAGGGIGGVSRRVVEQLLSHGRPCGPWCTVTTPARTRCAHLEPK